jgi:hypothetical protein
MGSKSTLDQAGAAAVYSASNQFSWARALLIPGVQAAASIALLEYQKGKYEDIRRDQAALLQIALDNYLNGVNAIVADPSFDAAYPDVPQAAEYVPVDPCQVAADTIACNIAQTGDAYSWAAALSKLHYQNDLTRMVVLDPRWMMHLEKYSISLRDLLRGRYQFPDLVSGITDASEEACLSARIKGCRSLRARNLGISKERMQAAGRAEMRQQAGLFENMSPSARQADIRSMMLTPEQRIALALTQAQLMQNSLQNYFNSQAAKPPANLAKINLQLEKAVNRLTLEASKASMSNTFVPNYAAILQPQINQLLSGFAGNYITQGQSQPSIPQNAYSTPSVGGDYQDYMGATPIVNPQK